MDEILVDGIPVGDGFGIDIHLGPPVRHPGYIEPARVEVWLTQRGDEGRYDRLRRIPPDAVVTVRDGEWVTIVQNGVMIRTADESEET